MEKLFIIGNGFDLHHGLPTKYTDFINFVKCEYPQVYKWLYESVRRYSLEYWDIIDKPDSDYIWNDLEALLGSFEPMELLEEHRDWESPVDYKGSASQEIQQLLHFGHNISKYLNAWLKSMEENITAFGEISSLFKSGGTFLTFNYTKTLEIVYGLQDVFHIHGVVGEYLIMGHGEGNCGNIYGKDFGINVVNQIG